MGVKKSYPTESLAENMVEKESWVAIMKAAGFDEALDAHMASKS